MNIKLVKNYNQIRPDRATLFCFPFAGGGASAYNSWVQKMKDKVTVCPIQLPGREERIMEKPYNNMTDMLDELEETIWKGKVRHAENKEDREVLFEIFKHNLLAALYYEVTDYCGNIKLLRCCNQTENFFINMIDGFSEDDMVWRKSKVKDIVTGEVQGDHISCMEFPYIKENINLIIEGI